jgi:hypothetical protein
MRSGLSVIVPPITGNIAQSPDETVPLSFHSYLLHLPVFHIQEHMLIIPFFAREYTCSQQPPCVQSTLQEGSQSSLH